MSWERETVYSDGGFYEKPKIIKQAEINNDVYKPQTKEEKK